MVLCSAPNCNVKGGMGVRLYYFPADNNLCEAWVEKLKKVNFWPSKHSKLCERHFTKDSFTMDPEPAKSVGFYRIALKKGAVPSVFDYTPLKSPVERKQTSENKRFEPGPPAKTLLPNEADLKTCALQPESSNQGPSNQSYPGKLGTTRTKTASATVSSVDSLSQPSAAKVLKKTGSQFENQGFENRVQKAVTLSVQPSCLANTPTQVQQHLQVVVPPPAPTQPAPRRVQVLASPVRVAVVKQNTVENPQSQEKRLLVVANHQQSVMSNLTTLWKNGKLCDAIIGNGSSTVMVHKLVLSAMCPKLVSVFNMDIMPHEFLQVNFPEEVSAKALNAFAEYMYNGILDLDHNILKQLKIIAKRLDMKEFEKLCDSHLPNHIHQPASASATLADSSIDVPAIQANVPIPAMSLSLASVGSAVSPSMQSALSINTPVIDIKHGISMDEVPQVKREAVVFSPESEVASLAPSKSGNAAGSVISSIIKTEPSSPEDNKYGSWCGSSSNQAFTSTTSSSSSSSITATASSSIASVPASSTELAIPFSRTTDVKSTRLKAFHSHESPLVSDLSPVSSIVETVRTQSNSMNEDFSKTISQSSNSPPSVDIPNSNDTVYPVRLFRSRGENLSPSATHSSDARTVNSFTPSEKT